MTVLVALPMFAPFDLPAEQWRHRVLLLFAPTREDPGLVEQRRLLSGQDAGIAERDLIVVEVVAGGPTERVPAETGAALRRQFHVAPDRFHAVLVGKDGSAKLKQDGPVAPARLFGKIDAMPMRRDEMKR